MGARTAAVGGRPADGKRGNCPSTCSGALGHPCTLQLFHVRGRIRGCDLHVVATAQHIAGAEAPEERPGDGPVGGAAVPDGPDAGPVAQGDGVVLVYRGTLEDDLTLTRDPVAVFAASRT